MFLTPPPPPRLQSSEYAHLSFVKRHLCDILELLAAPGGAEEGEGERGGGGRVSVEAVRALEFLLCCSLTHRDTVPLSEVVATDDHAEACGYSKVPLQVTCIYTYSVCGIVSCNIIRVLSRKIC